MALGIGIGMGIGGAAPLGSTGWFVVEAACAFTLPGIKVATSKLTNVHYAPGDYVQTKVSGPYAGKRVLLSDLMLSAPDGSWILIDIQPGSSVYNACQV